ncbi:hypothetical protein OIE50_02630 [Streptomyces canus]|uniref:hypothetical protein n=1 Tax=Streptomyces canus TaxID=58343 RepID=UPI0032540CC5
MPGRLGGAPKRSPTRRPPPTRADANLNRLRRENTDLRRTLALYEEEAIRQLALENDVLRSGSTVVPLPTRTVSASP